MFLLWLWYMMSWIAAVVMTRLCWRALAVKSARFSAKTAQSSAVESAHSSAVGSAWSLGDGSSRWIAFGGARLPKQKYVVVS